MISISDSKDYYDSVIAQAGLDDYSTYGYVVVVKNGFAAVSTYGHCSCYDTWDHLTNDGKHEPQFDWTGSLEELRNMAINCLDPVMPDRVATDNDNDYVYLVDVYKQTLDYFAKIDNDTIHARWRMAIISGRSKFI